MKKFQILVVDDEWNMRNLLRIYLDKNGIEVKEAKNGTEAIELINSNPFDLVILDVMMPDMDGWEVCSKIRETYNIPILMLTARTETRDKVQGLNLGADDYLTKPFDPEELLARVNALLRRARISKESTNESTMISFPGVRIDPDGRQIFIQEQEVIFTPKEFDILYLLATHHNQVFSREHIVSHVWGEDYYGDERTVDTHIKSIRGKIKEAGLSYNPIKTVWGIGYKFLGTDEQK